MELANPETIRQALSFVPSHDRKTWLRIGSAIKSELGEEGFELWDEWSQSAENYRERDMRTQWRSLRPERGISVGTLFYEAQARGFVRKPNGHATPIVSEQSIAARKEREAREAQELARKRDAAAATALAIWRSAQPCESHPYLTKKGVRGYDLRVGNWDQRGWKNALLLRVVNTTEERRRIGSLQAISESGQKDFLLNGEVSGGALAIGDDTSTALVAEGYATAASAHESTGLLSVVAFSASNLTKAAEYLRSKKPNATIIVLADLLKDRNEPCAEAIKAARAVGGLVAIPDFGPQRPKGAKDFNDLHQVAGAQIVKQQIEAAQSVEKVIEALARTSTNDETVPTWPEPRPIQAALHPVELFDPLILLPDALRSWVVDEADRMPCAPDFVAVTAIVALGGLIGARCAIKPKAKDDWLVVPNLWGGIVALPSAKKSPAIEAGMKPLNRLVHAAIKSHQVATEEFESERIVFEARKEALESRIKQAAKDPEKGSPEAIAGELREYCRDTKIAPTLRRYKTNDATVEKLGELLRENTAGIVVQRDELVGLLSSWDRDGREGERTFFLEAWNGYGSFDTDRIGRGSIFVPNLCLSIFGGIQPDKLTSYLEQAANALNNDGLLQRFQVLVYPDHQAWEWRDRLPNREASERVSKVFETLDGFDPVAWGAAPADDFNKVPHFRFEEGAQALFIEWMSDLQRVSIPREQQDGHPLIAQHLAKYDKLFPALALIFHLADCAITGNRGPVSIQAASRAAAWCDYLESHARRCYGLLADDGLRAAQALGEKLRQGKLRDGFTARDVRRNQWRYLTSDEAVRAALDWLEDEGWIAGKQPPKDAGGRGGRPTTLYSINPRLQKSAKAGTAKTDESQVSAVTAVRDPALSEKFEEAEA